MISFSRITNVSWQCVHFTQPDQISPIRTELANSPIAAFELDASSIKNDDILFSAISESLGFPDYFGCNWDALDECLSDLAWNRTEGYVLFVTNANELWKDAPYTAGGLISAWQHAAEQWSQEDIPFHLVFIL